MGHGGLIDGADINPERFEKQICLGPVPGTIADPHRKGTGATLRDEASETGPGGVLWNRSWNWIGIAAHVPASRKRKWARGSRPHTRRGWERAHPPRSEPARR
jgi:hypothetical protein